MVQSATGPSLNWDDLQFVISVARSGSFFRASAQIHTNASTVARRIQRLKAVLGTKIFDRYAHGMQLTPAGSVLLEKSLEIESIAQTIGAQLSGLDTLPVGTVKISVTEGVGSFWLTPKIARFCDIYPSIDVEIITNRDEMNLLSHEADIAVTLNRPNEPRLVVMRGATTSLEFFASEKYTKRLGLPNAISEFGKHEFVDYVPYQSSPDVSALLGSTLTKRRVRLRTTSASVYLAAIRSGIGIGLLPRFYKLSSPDLIELDIEANCRSEIWMVSHEETNKARRIRLLLSYLDEQFKTDRAFWQ